jgi:hypothetical protein
VSDPKFSIAWAPNLATRVFPAPDIRARWNSTVCGSPHCQGFLSASATLLVRPCVQPQVELIKKSRGAAGRCSQRPLAALRKELDEESRLRQRHRAHPTSLRPYAASGHQRAASARRITPHPMTSTAPGAGPSIPFFFASCAWPSSKPKTELSILSIFCSHILSAPSFVSDRPRRGRSRHAPAPGRRRVPRRPRMRPAATHPAA